MRALFLLFSAATLWAQSTSLFRVTPTPAAPGKIEFYEMFTNGLDSVSVLPPTSITTSFILTLPSAAPASDGQCLVGTTAGVLSFAACGGGSGGSGDVGGGANLITPGAVPYVNTSGILTEDADNLLWDTASLRLSVNGIAMPITTSSTTGVLFKGGFPYMHDYAPTTIAVGGNTFIGLDAGNFTMTATFSFQASYNVGTGKNVLNSLTTGYKNTASGYNSLTAVTEGFSNTGLGAETLVNLTTGDYNTAVGDGTLKAAGVNVIGNTGVGWEVMGTTSGNYNTGMGYRSMNNLSSGSNNSAYGYQALYGVLTGTHNIGIGSGAGQQGSNSRTYSVAIGANAGSTTYLQSNKLHIHSAAVATDYPLIGGNFSTREVHLHAANTYIYNPTASAATSVHVGWNGTSDSATSTSLIVRAGNSQGTTSLQQWQDTSGTVLAEITSSGAFSAGSFAFASGTEGTCDSSKRGVTVTTFGGTGVDDTTRICARDAAGLYAWRALY